MPRPWVIIYPSKKKKLLKNKLHFQPFVYSFLAENTGFYLPASKIKKDSWLDWRQNPGGLAGVVATSLAEESVPFCDITKGSFARTSYFRTTGKAEESFCRIWTRKNKQTRLLIVRKNAINPAEKKKAPPGYQLITSNMSLRPTILSFQKLLHWFDAQRYDMTYGA